MRRLAVACSISLFGYTFLHYGDRRGVNIIKGTMMHILIQWLVNAVAVYATAHILSGIHIKSFGAAILVALVLGLVNAVVRPVLVFFSIPFIIVTLGLFLLVINAFLLQFAAILVSGFSIDSFGWAVAGSVVISVISWVLSSLFNY